jgi:Flp pilus assembly pilin Flp
MEVAMEYATRFAVDESGQDSIEYVLVAALVGPGAVASLKALSTRVSTVFTSIGTTLATIV